MVKQPTTPCQFSTHLYLPYLCMHTVVRISFHTFNSLIHPKFVKAIFAQKCAFFADSLAFARWLHFIC